MDLLQEILSLDAVYRLGWTLLHTLWQGAGMAALLGLLLVSLRRCSANARYLAGCVALGMMLVIPIQPAAATKPITQGTPTGANEAEVELLTGGQFNKASRFGRTAIRCGKSSLRFCRAHLFFRTPVSTRASSNSGLGVQVVC